MDENIDRRSFLRLAGVTAGGAVLSGCADGIFSGSKKVLAASATPFAKAKAGNLPVRS